MEAFKRKLFPLHYLFFFSRIITMDDVRKYFNRKPITMPDLLRKFRSRGIPTEDLIKQVGEIINKLKPKITIINEKNYYSLE